MEHTFVNRWDTLLTNRAKGYSKTKTGWQNAAYLSMEGPYSAGAIISTAEDLYKWNNALFSNKIISATSFKKMTTPYSSSYGYGLFIDTFQHHVRIWHSGGIPGFVSYLVRFPADSVVVVVLSNNGRNSPIIGNGLAANAFGIQVIPPYKHVEAKIDSTVLNNYIGKYKRASFPEIEIIKKDGKFYRHMPDSDIELKAESKTMFFYADESDRQIQFEIDKSGKVVAAFLIIGGIKEELKRL